MFLWEWRLRRAKRTRGWTVRTAGYPPLETTAVGGFDEDAIQVVFDVKDRTMAERRFV